MIEKMKRMIEQRKPQAKAYTWLKGSAIESKIRATMKAKKKIRSFLVIQS